jgi:hypothetical protein
MPRKQKSPTITQSITLDKNRCRFTTTDGRRCRMYRAKGHKSLCLTHAQQEEQMVNAETVAAELIGPVEEYQTALCVNRTLGCLFNMIAQKRISNKDGALLAYIGQMLLQSVGSTIKDEFLRVANEERGTSEWDANVLRACEILSNDYSLRDKKRTEHEAEAAAETEAQEAPAGEPLIEESPNEEPAEIEVATEEPPQAEATPADVPEDFIENLIRTLDNRRRP